MPSAEGTNQSRPTVRLPGVREGYGFRGFRLLGFRLLGFRVLGFRVLGFRVQGSGLGFYGL